jgi:hypothetical protein
MPIVVKQLKLEYSVAPEGLHAAVCCDVVDKGVIKGQWGEAHKVEIRWQLEEIDPTTNPPRPYMVVAWYTLSLHEKSRLRPMLAAWRGRKFTPEELAGGFDLEKLIGTNCQVQIVHNIREDGGTFASVQAVVPPAKDAVKFRVSPTYVRVQDRDRVGKDEMPAKATIDDNDVPF